MGTRPSMLAALAALLAVLALGVAAPPSSALSRAQYPVVALGSRGADVNALQRFLRDHGSAIAATGIFDDATQTALSRFQATAQLISDGVARPATWRALVRPLRPGSSGEAVLAAQEQLNDKRGAGLVLSGRFDGATEEAVQRLQRRVGLPPNGVVDGATWRHLIWLFKRPQLGGALCGYELNSGRSPKWGTAGAVAQLDTAARTFSAGTGARVALGDISHELGGDISGHATHEVGLDVDIRPMRRDERECRWGIAYYMRTYDRAGTRALIREIRAAAPGRVKLIYFNDPVLIREGLVQRYPNHDAHLHVRYCEVGHPKPAYRCRAATSVAAAQLTETPADGGATGPAEAIPGAGVALARSPAPRSFWPS